MNCSLLAPSHWLDGTGIVPYSGKSGEKPIVPVAVQFNPL